MNPTKIRVLQMAAICSITILTILLTPAKCSGKMEKLDLKLRRYGNCKGEGQNIYPSLEACQWICERHKEERAPSYCLDHFDLKYTESCAGRGWTEKWYFDVSLISTV